MAGQQMGVIADQLSATYLGDERWGGEIQAIIHNVRTFRDGVAEYGHGSRRREHLASAAKHAAGLRVLLSKIDARTLIETMGPIVYGPVMDEDVGRSDPTDGDTRPDFPGLYFETVYSMAPLRHSQLSMFRTTLEKVAVALAQASSNTTIRKSRPSTSDPLLLGVEWLAKLWEAARQMPAANSYKKGSFGSLAVDVLGKHLEFETSEIKTAVRMTIANRKSLTD
jgi:hypothetical protein